MREKDQCYIYYIPPRGGYPPLWTPPCRLFGANHRSKKGVFLEGFCLPGGGTPPGLKTHTSQVRCVKKGSKNGPFFHDRQIVISRPPRNARFSRGARFGQWSKFLSRQIGLPNSASSWHPSRGPRLLPSPGTPYGPIPFETFYQPSSLSPLLLCSFTLSAGRSWISGAYHIPSPSQPRSSNYFRKDPDLSTFCCDCVFWCFVQFSPKKFDADCVKKTSAIYIIYPPGGGGVPQDPPCRFFGANHRSKKAVFLEGFCLLGGYPPQDSNTHPNRLGCQKRGRKTSPFSRSSDRDFASTAKRDILSRGPFWAVVKISRVAKSASQTRPQVGTPHGDPASFLLPAPRTVQFQSRPLNLTLIFFLCTDF